MQKSADEETQKEIESKQGTAKTNQEGEGAAKQKEEVCFIWILEFWKL